MSIIQTLEQKATAKEPYTVDDHLALMEHIAEIERTYTRLIERHVRLNCHVRREAV